MICKESSYQPYFRKLLFSLTGRLFSWCQMNRFILIYGPCYSSILGNSLMSSPWLVSTVILSFINQIIVLDWYSKFVFQNSIMNKKLYIKYDGIILIWDHQTSFHLRESFYCISDWRSINLAMRCRTQIYDNKFIVHILYWGVKWSKLSMLLLGISLDGFTDTKWLRVVWICLLAFFYQKFHTISYISGFWRKGI